MQNLTYQDSTKSMPLMSLPVRTTIVEATAGRIIFSPGSRLSAEQLRAQGNVSEIVAPSLLHTAGMAAAAAVHPTARLWGVAGADEKDPKLRWHGVLEPHSWPYQNELPCLPLEGIPETNETLLFHRASKTLLLVDLVFNLKQAQGFGSWLVLTLFGAYRRLATNRLLAQKVKNRDAFLASIARIMALDFENMVPTHGEIVQGNAKALLSSALDERGLR